MKTKLRLVGGLTAGLILFAGLTGCSSSDDKEKTTATTAKAGATETTKAGATATTKAGETATTKAGATATTAKAAEATTTVKK